MIAEPVKILLAEDNEDDVFSVRRAFRQAKFLNVVDVVRDGEETLAYLRRQDPYQSVELPGLLLLDIGMPKKDGLAVLQEIKSDPAFKSLPVIMLTTSQQEEDVVKAYSHGACSYISKPVGFELLQKMVGQFELYWTLVSRVPGVKNG